MPYQVLISPQGLLQPLKFFSIGAIGTTRHAKTNTEMAISALCNLSETVHCV